MSIVTCTIRPATVKDIPAVGRIINDCAEFGQMLHRSHAYLYENVRDFQVLIYGTAVVGVCGLRIVWANLAEVYALAIAPAHRGWGQGRRLVEACVVEARDLGIRRLMTLTYEQQFFAKLGFETCDREQLPLKVWSECARCLKNQSCDEIAMVRPFDDIPDLPEATPDLPGADEYVVPVTLKVGQVSRGQKMDDMPRQDQVNEDEGDKY